MKTSIVIVNHNTSDVLADCVRSILKFESETDTEIIIIDNASGVESVNKLTKLKVKYPLLKIIYIKELKSFSHANNLGIKESTGEFVLIMNPDIIFTEPILHKLTNHLYADKTIGAVTPALIGTNGKFQRNYFQRYPTIRQYIYYQSILAKLFNRSAKRMNRFLENQDIDTDTGKMFKTEQIPFAFFITRREIFDKTGYLDEDYELFFEDVDFCYRLNNIYSLVVDTSIRITHLGGSSFKSEMTLYGRYMKSMLHFFRKFRGKSKYTMLKVIVKFNSYIVIIIESFKSIFGKQNSYRKNKHVHMLKLLRSSN